MHTFRDAQLREADSSDMMHISSDIMRNSSDVPLLLGIYVSLRKLASQRREYRIRQELAKRYCGIAALWQLEIRPV